MDAGRDTRPPRGALAVIAVGLVATVAAAWLSTDKPIGAASLEWAGRSPLPDSPPVAIPGGGEMRLVEAGIRAGEPNAGGYTLYRVAAALRIAPGSAVGRARVRCAIKVPPRTIVAHTPRSRASYPRSSEELRKQDVPEHSLIEFNARGADLALVDLGDAIGSRYTDVSGIVVEWEPFRVGWQVWRWGLPEGAPERALRLPFVSIWRTTATPAARISCTVETASGRATARTSGSL